jgi:hypothetical protein
MKPMRLAWVSALAGAALLFVACSGGGSSPKASPTTPGAAQSTTTISHEDAKLTAADFHNIHRMTRVDDYFVGNVNGHLKAALAVARSKDGGVYPVGTILQLVPQEAMVKRRVGFSPKTNDWEFFSLDVSPTGTKILTRGGAEVLNRFGGSCANCHGAADPKFDLVCGKTHGCAPLPVSDDLIATIQKIDPRPR